MTLLSSDRKKKNEEQQLKLKKRREQLNKIFSEICITADGILVLRHIMEICGYQKISIVGDPVSGDIHDRGTLYNEARRNVYLEIRKYIPSRFLKQIEFPSIKK